MPVGKLTRNGKRVIVHFTALELWACWELAGRRTENKRNNKTRDRRYDKQQSSREIDYLGLKGEQAVSRFLDVPIDTRLYNGADYYDLLFRGLELEVKLSQRHLYFNPGKVKGDIIILIQPHLEGEHDPYITKSRLNSWDVCLRGWVTKDEFMSKHHIDNWGYGDRLVMNPGDLFDVYDLFRLGGDNGR